MEDTLNVEERGPTLTQTVYKKHLDLIGQLQGENLALKAWSEEMAAELRLFRMRAKQEQSGKKPTEPEA